MTRFRGPDLRNSILKPLLLAVAFCLAWQIAGRAEASPRVALVIGIGAYRHVPALANPPNDARLLADTLQRLGFTLVGGAAQIDLDKVGFDRAVQEFGKALVGAEVGLFYYAGHGLQVEGENWLAPVDADPTRAQDLDFEMVNASLVLRQMDGAGTKLNVLILDACRNNPFGEPGLRAAGGGLAQMLAPEGTLIAYATQPGNVAFDGATGHSPFSTALARVLLRRDLDVFRLFNQVGLDVKRATGGQQQPWISSSPIDGDFYFASTTANAGASTVAASSESAAEPPPRHEAMLMFPAPPAAEDNLGAARALQEGQAAEGRGDYTLALAWYRRAADLGSADAACDLGWLYQNGLGVPADLQQAAAWYRRAAQAGHVMAANNLGVLYKNGLGVERDYTEALRWYRKAAEAGNAEAENNIGVMYNDGLGVSRDAKQAVQWFTRAAQNGNLSAEVNLGLLYKNGIGVPQDYPEAVRWLQRAAEAGSAVAALNMGLLYEDGLGVTKDHGKALTWIRKAAEGGNADARRLLAGFEG
jgi:TPR repeat protein/uncharacterized caspase-like protein